MKKILSVLAAITMLTSIMPVSFAYPLQTDIKNHQKTKGNKQVVKGQQLEQKGIAEQQQGNINKGNKDYQKGAQLIQKGQKEYQKGASY